MSTEAIPEPDDQDEVPPYLLDAPPMAQIVQLPGTTPVPEPKPARKSPIDLQRLERDYRAAELTTRECGRKHGISGARVVQLAKQHGWTRDITAQARQRAAVLLARAPKAEPEELNEQPAIIGDIDAAAGQMAFVRRKHRKLIEEARGVLEGLLREVKGLAVVGDIERMYLAAMKETDPQARATGLKTTIDRIVAMPSRIYGIKKLSDAAKNIIQLERQAYDLDAPDEGRPPPPKDKDTTPAEVYAWLSQLRP